MTIEFGLGAKLREAGNPRRLGFGGGHRAAGREYIRATWLGKYGGSERAADLRYGKNRGKEQCSEAEQPEYNDLLVVIMLALCHRKPCKISWMYPGLTPMDLCYSYLSVALRRSAAIHEYNLGYRTTGGSSDETRDGRRLRHI